MKNLTYAVTILFLFGLHSATTTLSQTLPLVGNPPVGGVDRYNETIPTPDKIIGHMIGGKHTRPHLIVEYFNHVATLSDRVVFGEHGSTYDGRPLVHAIVTSPHNQTRLGEIRDSNLRLSNEPGSVADTDISNMPAVIWMGYGVHGNEASSFEAAMLLLYHLAAGEGPGIENLLNDLVIIIIPSLNPDGHSRHVNWVNSQRGAVPVTDPQHREHNEPWPGGRTNYYWFDLNRDWFPVQHPESRGRIRLYNEWRPQLVTDYHEFGSNATYFFQPGISSRYNPHIPSHTIGLLKEVGEYHAAALDEKGVLYYTRETFDDFYIGKGSTYPMVTGAIGILFEQASPRALIRETQRGLLTFDSAIMNQYTTSLSTLEACFNLRENLLKNQRDFYREADEYAQRTGVRAYIVDLESDRTRGQLLIDILLQHRIEVYELAQPVRDDQRTFNPGSAIVIPTGQPEARLIFSAFERRTEFQDSLFYDISSWTLPLAFNIPYVEYRRNPQQLIGESIRTIEPDGGVLQGGRAHYAYILEWNRYYAPRALYRLQKNNVQTSVATQPFTVPGERGVKEFKRGSIVIPVTQQNITEIDLFNLIQRIVEKEHVNVYAARSSRTVEGPDLGSPAIRVLDKPVVAVLAGPGTSSSEVGEVWHLLSERMRIPVALLDCDAVDTADLRKYNTLVMVNGRYTALSDTGRNRIVTWVEEGGTLITTKNATRIMAEKGLLDLKINESDIDYGDVPYEDVMSAVGAHRIGGAIFEIRIDTTHPIAFGYNDKIPVFRNHETFLEIPGNPGESIAVYTDSPLLSGYISGARLEELKNTAAIAAQRVGRGRVIAFADNPNFRAFWFGTNGLFLNALFFGGII
jgi:hypothetical protein